MGKVSSPDRGVQGVKHSALMKALLIFGLSGIAVCMLTLAWGFGAASYTLDRAAVDGLPDAIDRQQAFVGDRLRFTLTLVTDSTTSVDSIPVGKSLGDFDVIARRHDLSADKSGGLKHTIDLDLAAYKIGRFSALFDRPCPTWVSSNPSTRRGA